MFRLLVIVFYVLPFFSLAQNIESFVKEVELAEDSKNLAQEIALKEVSQFLVEELLGDNTLAQNKKRIEKTITENHNRYVLSITSSKGELGENGKFLFKIHIKVSKENLKALLIEHKLFYISEGSFCVLPVVSFSLDFEGKKESYSWWRKKNKSSKQLEQLAKTFFDSLSREFIKIGFFVIDPIFQRSIKSLPSSVLPRRGKSLKRFARLSKFYNCDIILSGHVHLGKSSVDSSFYFSDILSSNKQEKNGFQSKKSYWIQFSFHVSNIKTGQSLFRLKKQFPFDEKLVKQPESELKTHSKTIFESLVYQMSSSTEGGSLALDRFLLSLQGPLTYAEKERLAKMLTDKIEGLESLKVRYMSVQHVVYSAEVSKNLKEISKSMKMLSFSPFQVQVRMARGNRLELYAKKSP